MHSFHDLHLMLEGRTCCRTCLEEVQVAEAAKYYGLQHLSFFKFKNDVSNEMSSPVAVALLWECAELITIRAVTVILRSDRCQSSSAWVGAQGPGRGAPLPLSWWLQDNSQHFKVDTARQKCSRTSGNAFQISKGSDLKNHTGQAPNDKSTPSERFQVV